MTSTSHKDSTNSYTSADDLIPEYSFEDLPSERDCENDINDIFNSILAILFSIIALTINLLILLFPFILVGVIFYFLFLFN